MQGPDCEEADPETEVIVKVLTVLCLIMVPQQAAVSSLSLEGFALTD